MGLLFAFFVNIRKTLEKKKKKEVVGFLEALVKVFLFKNPKVKTVINR